MALIPTTLEADLLTIFLAMNDIMDDSGDDYQAEKMAAAIKKYILTGVTSTTDTGAAPAGSYSGASVGVMSIDADTLESDLKKTFAKKSDNPTLAADMAADIDNACKADDTVTAVSAGTVTTGTGATVPFSGQAIGKFSGDKSKISTPLAACFESMNGMMTGGGNEYYAKQMSIAVTAYLTAGKITVELKTPFSSGSGEGKIA